MSRLNSCVLLAALSLACSRNATAPAAPTETALRLDIVSPVATAHLGDLVMLTVTATNDGSQKASWSSSCGLDLSFELVTLDGVAVESPVFGTCTLELRQLSLDPNASMARAIQWQIGSLRAPGRQLPPGRYRVRGRLGVRDSTTRRGTDAGIVIVN